MATLNDGAQSSDNSLRFYVTFGPDCTNDALLFTGTLGAQAYYIESVPQTKVIDPAMIQTVADCPVRCSLGQDGGINYSDEGI